MKSYQFAIGAALVAAVAYFVMRELRAKSAPRWPSRKKVRRDARRAQAARRAHEPVKVRPATVHVERDAQPELRAPLADLTK